MNKIFKRVKWLYGFALLFVLALAALFINLELHSREWVIKDFNRHLYSNGALLAAGTVSDRNGVVLAITKNGERKYNEDPQIRKATLHIVGDAAGFISSGVQYVYKSELTGFNPINGIYALKKNGAGNDMQLSADARLSAYALSALGRNKGTVGVYNYRNGEILCAVSSPTYDIYNKPKDIAEDESGKYEGIYMNRFFSGLYTPGSTFKIVTACSALEHIDNIESRSFYCNGAYVTRSGSKVKCLGRHGEVNLERALNHSCNSAFAAIAVELGNEALSETAEELGFNKPLSAGGIKCAQSFFDLSHAYDIDRGWAGIGQYTTLVNPCHMAVILGAIANGTGTTPAPTLIRGDRTAELSFMDANVARRLDALLRSNVVNYYGEYSFPKLKMCGKTGTAEVKGKKPHALFVGYSQREDLPLCIVVVLENSGSSGRGSAIPVANNVMQEALKISEGNSAKDKGFAHR